MMDKIFRKREAPVDPEEQAFREIRSGLEQIIKETDVHNIDLKLISSVRRQVSRFLVDTKNKAWYHSELDSYEALVWELQHIEKKVTRLRESKSSRAYVAFAVGFSYQEIHTWLREHKRWKPPWKETDNKELDELRDIFS